MIFLDRLDSIDGAIQSRSHLQFLHQDKFGKTCLFVFDESTRMLAIYAPATVCPKSNFVRLRDRRPIDATSHVRI
jgi:hypothetical protein